MGQDTTIWNEIILTEGTYRYRALAHRNDDGQGQPCDSAPTNIATVVVANQLPDAPSDLTTSLNGNSIQIDWTDNSNNEQNFILE